MLFRSERVIDVIISSSSSETEPPSLAHHESKDSQQSLASSSPELPATKSRSWLSLKPSPEQRLSGVSGSVRTDSSVAALVPSQAEGTQNDKDVKGDIGTDTGDKIDELRTKAMERNEYLMRYYFKLVHATERDGSWLVELRQLLPQLLVTRDE